VFLSSLIKGIAMAKEAIVIVEKLGHRWPMCITVRECDTPQTISRFVETQRRTLKVVSVELK
jgi:hypothetical protein